MSTLADNRPQFPPSPVGEILGDEIESRGWTQADFAGVLGRPTQFVSEIVTGKKEITRESAAQIGVALGTSAEMWLRLQDQYLLWQQSNDRETQQKLDNVRRRATLNNKAPIALLQKRNILRGRTLDELEAEVLELFDVPSLEDVSNFALAARRSNGEEEISPAQNAWVACVRREARRRTPATAFSAHSLEELAATLPSRLGRPEDFKGLPGTLARVGVCLVYVEAFPGAKIDGCALFVDSVPVIGLSGRGKRLDKILFTLLHEIAHLCRGHVSADTLIVEAVDEHEDNERPGGGTKEKEANELAASWVLPKGLPTIPGRIGVPWIMAVASDLGVAPIVVVGQLQKRGDLDWRTTLARNAPTVAAALESWSESTA